MLQVFRVAGIPVRIDASWVLVFALISWSLAVGYFPRMLPEATTGIVWLHGVVAALLLFVSVFLHELSHALVALEHGVPVSGIRLHVFGGVSELEAEPPTPRAELLIAAVGPLTSFMIAALCYGVGRSLGGPPWVSALTGYLAVVNLLIGLFNLVPGFPLDGGRLLRAMLWWASGRQAWATIWASRAGVAFGFAMMALGALRAIAGDIVGGLWFVFIGMFLYRAARVSRTLIDIRQRLEPLHVADVMSSAVAAPAADVTSLDDAVAPETSAWQAYLKLDRADERGLPVIADGRLVGVVKRRDLHHALTERPGADVADRAA
ncbi:MAG TPA: site-2 protease family protein [Methylomirabilota bacterium]|nr:site-2 protease family protein [Methylomirabilota bacterium]